MVGTQWALGVRQHLIGFVMAAKQPSRPVIKVGIATTDWSGSVVDDRGWPVMGGSGWIRLGQWSRLSQNHVVVGGLMNNGSTLGVQLADQQVHIDIPAIVMQRYMDSRTTELVRRARRFGQRVINDLDDWFWEISEKNAAAKYVNPDENPNSNINHYRKTLESSDLVTVSTPFLAEQISEWGVPVRIIENAVSAFMFPTRKHRPGKPVVGWVGSTAHRSGDLQVLKDFYSEISTMVSFHHTGQHPYHPQFCDEVDVAPDSVTTLPMLSPFEYPHGFTFDIGVVPLVDIPFNHAKSWIKGLEYAAAGIPFIASPLPEYVRLQKEYGIGRLAYDRSDWVSHIEELSDPVVRAEEAARQRAAVESDFHVKRMARAFDDAVWP